MNKVLFVATVVKTHIMQFHIPYLALFKEHGWETAVAARNDYENTAACTIPHCDTYYDVPFERTPTKRGNLKAYKAIKNIIDSGGYDIVHCHTPMAALLTRLAARKARKRGTRILYTAHGFHFYKGAPLMNWLIYFPAEWLCSFMTDTLVTINHEDYAFAKKHLHAKKVEYVPGVGVDLQRYGNAEENTPVCHMDFVVPEDKVWVLNVGELIPRKNQELLIHAVAGLPEVYLTIAGSGELQEKLMTLIKELHLESRVQLLGYRNDLPALYEAADLFVFPSFQEGLPVALIEAMACGKAVACSRIRGNIDLVDGFGGVLFDPHSVDACREAILQLMAADRRSMGERNRQAVQAFSLENVREQMKEIYFPV